ncbi:uncharacterized protein LOC127251938 [Andrographis paniculata]|uniref:uncharacterized protein LOC127251938 n=1 Tax=Andrographis paniculata TaxID=175694 RepID=UPI0021E95825|nr:uncharacterized protein LOC127251938 [Andrographis paniculata]
MDSLLANYASSDEDDGEEQPLPTAPAGKPGRSKPESIAGGNVDGDFLPDSGTRRGGIFGSLPPPTKSSLFNSLPPPKSDHLPLPKPEGKVDRRAEADEREGISNPNPKSSSSTSLFSSLPSPKLTAPSSSSTSSKKVVQFRPPTMTSAYAARADYEDDDEEEDEKERQRKRSKASLSTSSASSFLSSIPAPKHSTTLGALPSASGTGRRSMLETDTPASSASTVGAEVANADDGYTKDQSSEMVYDYSTQAYYSGYSSVSSSGVGVNSDGLSGESHAYYGTYNVGSTAGDDANVNTNLGSYEGVDYSYVNEQNVGYTDYDGGYGNNAQYEDNWVTVSAVPEASGVIENVLPVPGKRGRKDVPPQIVEVNQDELMKNRPRQDQVKLTGIAFGPAYQPTSTKGKPTKLHKRKHQIGALYFDMKQKEMELAERRSQGLLTKAQTQAKYGW